MSLPIPVMAVKWMTPFLRQHFPNYSHKYDVLERGIDLLTVKELKLILRKVEDAFQARLSSKDHERLGGIRRLGNPAKKADIAKAIQRLFYKDEDCTVVVGDNDIIWHILKCCRKSPESNCSSTSQNQEGKCVKDITPISPPILPTNIDLNVDLSNNHNANGRYKTNNLLMSQSHGDSIPTSFAERIHHSSNSTSGSGNKDDPVNLVSINPWSIAARKIPEGTGHLKRTASVEVEITTPQKKFKETQERNTIIPHRKIKIENSINTTRPISLRESQMLSQLRVIGFTNDEETMIGIRNVERGQEPEQLLEEVTLYLITQREEAEEARKVDLVRQQSEIEREAEIESKVKKNNMALYESSMNRILNSKEFVNSIILSQNGVKQILETHKKTRVIKFLQLEKKALKWYGKTIPYMYFKEIGKKLVNLESLIKELEDAMYSLKEQDGMGVPKLFLQNKTENQIEVDEVIFLENIDKNLKNTCNEVIEID